ncbi:MAG TPA: heavy metal-binding domain-containing protein [Vicinamibacterales bacterium]|nr:heavy metal-binding domain-containing protein [Vicinamibacterales bacterium]
MSKYAVVATVLALAASPAATPRQTTQPPTRPDLPPVSYVCPMPADGDIIEDHPGKCPRCGMTLNPVRLDTTWTCPVHAAVHRDAPGKCPIDRRDLIQVTMSINWACPGAAKSSLEPGTCPDGSPMTEQYLPRPHGNHNPQHGGLFFMAPDNWHHLEGTYPRAGVFRVYLYDDYTKPLPLDQVRAVAAHVVMNGKAFDLVPARRSSYLEAAVASSALPATMQARIKFKSEAVKQDVFDFQFTAYSIEPGRVAVGTMTSASVAAPPVAAKSSAALAPPQVAPPPASPSLPPTVSPGYLTTPLPTAVPDLLGQLRARTDQIRDLIDKGRFGEVYVPAFQAKDLAIALETHQGDVPSDRRSASEAALTTVVRDAYLLDAFGDLGNREQITEAFHDFAEASKAILTLFPGR